jgi:hypothetical protein
MIEVTASDLATLLSNALPFTDTARPALAPKLTWDAPENALRIEATDSYVLLRQHVDAAPEGAEVPAWTCQIDPRDAKSLVTWLKTQKGAKVAVTLDGSSLTIGHPSLGSTVVPVIIGERFPNTEQIYGGFTPSDIGDIGIGADRMADLAKLRAIGSKPAFKPSFQLSFGKDNLSPIRWKMVGDNAYGLLMPYKIPA